MSKLHFKITVTALVALLACGKEEPPPCNDCGPTAAGGSSAGASTGGTASIGGDAGSTGGGGLVACAPWASDWSSTWSLALSPDEAAGGAGGANSESNGGAPAAGGAGGANSESGGRSGGKAGPCQVTQRSDSYLLSCEGEALVGGTQSAPQLTLADGTVLAYLSPEITAPVFPDDHAWIDLSYETLQLCPFCGSTSSYSVEVRAAPSGPLLFVELSGGHPKPPSADVLAQVFGAELREMPSCQYEFEEGCYHVTRQRLDLTIATVPEQLLRHGEVQQVTSRSGDRFDVLASWSADESVRIPTCQDGGIPRRDHRFVASRLAP